MNRDNPMVKMWATIAGIVLIPTGVIGFLGTSLVGSASGALIPTDSLHNVIHLINAAVAVVSLGVAMMARSGTPARV